MLSKEEIEKAKERISKSLNDTLFCVLYSQEENEKDEKILLAYIKQLETKLESAYWEGYTQKQKEAVEICKTCKYKNKVEQLESDKQDLIEKLEEDISRFNTYKNMHQLSLKGVGALEYAQEILEIMKGEKE